MSADHRPTPRWPRGNSSGRGWPDDLTRVGTVPAPERRVLEDAMSRLRQVAAAEPAEPADNHLDLVRERARAARRARASSRRTALLAAGAIAAALAAVLVLDAPWAISTQPPEVVATGQGPVPMADDGASDCAVSYPEDLAEQVTFAFDGSITSIDTGGPFETLVTFQVDTWFRGPDTDAPSSITLPMSPPEHLTATGSLAGGPTSDSPNSPETATPSYTVGTRLLVAGASRFGGGPLEDPVVWGCDFTRYYDQPTAQQWDAALD